VNRLLTGLKIVNLHIGGLYASDQPMAIRTVLGSCVAACLYDPHQGIGGMNHFMLPHPVNGDYGLPTRYGVNAMELLINRLMKLGTARGRLRAKLFGAANVLHSRQGSPSVAERNATFAREFLTREGIPIVTWRVGGFEPLEVVFFPRTARTFVKPVRKLSEAYIAELEAEYTSKLDKRAAHVSRKDITLF
jgi:chemotaxis protein CheD